MRKKVNRQTLSLLASIVFWCAGPAVSFAGEDEDFLAAARSASCKELADEYKSGREGEQKLVEAIGKEKGKTVATNVIGVATMATIGIGFFTWHDTENAEQNLADLRKDIDVIKKVATEKKCKLPEMAKAK